MSWLSRKFNDACPAPVVRKGNVTDCFYGQTISDPYRHLEDLDAQETLSWAHGHKDRFDRFVADYPRRKPMTDFLRDIWDYPRDSIPGRYGDKWFKSHNPGLAPQSILMVADNIDGPWETLLDPNTLSKDGTVALSGRNIHEDGKCMIYLLSEAGSDEQTLYIMDTETGQTLSDKIEGCRFTGTSWDEDGKGFLYSYPANDGKKNFVMKHHTIGEDPSRDPVVYARQDWEQGHLWISRDKDWDYEYLYESVGTARTNALSIRDKGSDKPFTQMFGDGVAYFSVRDEIDGKILMMTDRDCPKGKAVYVDPDNPEPENWQTVLPEKPDGKLKYVFEHKGKLYAGYSHDTADEIRIYDLEGKEEGQIPLPPQSIAGFGRRNEEDDEFLIRVSGFQTPGSVYKYDIQDGDLDLYIPTKAKADLQDCIVERIRATSKDGTKVPMTVIRRKDTTLDGSAATKLYGYGGFNIPLGPGFSFSVLNWVREGGIYVQANLRGGGEFGRDWYEEGRLEHKQNVFDDFIACAEHLIDKDYTSSSRLVIEGGSNGGLLTSACMLQRPELFGAVISSVPVTDMLRFDKHTYGAAWKSDYGDPENSKKDFEVAMKYSPLHNVKKGAKYPPILVKTADHDDRVVPSHAYKFVATMQDKSHKDNLIMLRVEKDAGHGAGKPTEKIIDEMVETFAFVEKTIGSINQKHYKRTLTQGRKNEGPQQGPS